VDLGTDYYDIEAYYSETDGKRKMPAAGLAIRPLPGANALDIANNIQKKMNELSRNFPPGVKTVYLYDTTPFTMVAIKEVAKHLIEAIILVFFIMWLFMGSITVQL